MSKGTPVDIHAAFEGLTFLATRTPERVETAEEAFATMLSAYREGGVFVAHFAGGSEWERHGNGDELVMVVEGETDVFLLEDGREKKSTVREGQLIVVPASTWHRFETTGVKILTVTPRPTDHRTEFPE